MPKGENKMPNIVSPADGVLMPFWVLMFFFAIKMVVFEVKP